MTTILVAEKKKAAEAIAQASGKITSTKKERGISVYHIASKDLYVIPLRGHILGYQNTKKFKSWTKSNPRDIITDPDSIEKVPLNYAHPYIQVLKDYSKKSDHLIIGTDADIEGCNIGLFDALPIIKNVKPNIKISQLWLSSLQTNEIKNKLNQLIPPKWHWGETGEARAIIDAFIGFSATREVTNTLKPLLTKFGIKFTSIGRVQTSLLYLIYLREKRIDDFIPEPYFTIEVEVNHEGDLFKAFHDSNPFKKEEETKVKSIYSKIKSEKIARIIDNSTKPINKKPPAPLNTSKALILLTKQLNISAKQAFSTMNSLYLNKIISYPRTDSDIYKPDFNHQQYLDDFAKHSQYGNYTSKILRDKRLNPTKGKKDAGDHPPITPLVSLELGSSKFENKLQGRVYDVLSRHYLALFGENAKESKTRLRLDIKTEPFSANFVSLINEGFLEIVPFLKQIYNDAITIKGNQIPIDKIAFNEKETRPPPKYTDTTLLKLMERNHLGTKATRPVIIEVLEKRNLIYRNSKRYSITELGAFLIEILIKVWLPFLKPDFTMEIELLLDQIKEGKKNMNEVVKKVRMRFLSLFDKFLASKPSFQKEIQAFKDSSKEVIKDDFPETTAPCPFCNSAPMKLITPRNRSKRRFLVCSNEECKKYLSVPKTGGITILKSRCSKCGFNVFSIRTRKGRRWFSYHICPYCWTLGLQDKSNSQGFCPKCNTHEIKNGKCVKK